MIGWPEAVLFHEHSEQPHCAQVGAKQMGTAVLCGGELPVERKGREGAGDEVRQPFHR